MRNKSHLTKQFNTEIVCNRSIKRNILLRLSIEDLTQSLNTGNAAFNMVNIESEYKIKRSANVEGEEK